MVLFFAYFGTLSVLFKFISVESGIIACMIGLHVVAVSGWSIWPLVLFFITGSLFSRLPLKNKSENAGTARGINQIIANGAVIFILSVIQTAIADDIEILYLISVSIAFADTAGSEIGSRYGRKTWDIKNLRPINAGVSGGISWMGSMSTLFAAAAVGSFSGSTSEFFVILIAGITGSLADSLIGSFFQIKYLTPAGEQTDFKTARVASGLPWMTNDMVNFLSNAVVTSLFAIILL